MTSGAAPARLTLSSRVSKLEAQMQSVLGLNTKIEQLLTFIDGLTRGVTRLSEQQTVLDIHVQDLKKDIDARLDVLDALLKRLG